MQRVKCSTNYPTPSRRIFPPYEQNRCRSYRIPQPTPEHDAQTMPSSNYVSDSLQTCTHVFVRHDAVKVPLQQTYDGPFLVIKRNEKFFTINKNGCSDTVSIDRLKPEFIEKTWQVIPPVPIPQPGSMLLPLPSLTTGSDRAANLPVRSRTWGGLLQGVDIPDAKTLTQLPGERI